MMSGSIYKIFEVNVLMTCSLQKNIQEHAVQRITWSWAAEQATGGALLPEMMEPSRHAGVSILYTRMLNQNKNVVQHSSLQVNEKSFH